MPERGGHFFARIIVLSVRLDCIWHLRQVIKTIAILLMVAVVVCMFFFISIVSEMDTTVGATSGCSVFVMHCL